MEATLHALGSLLLKAVPTFILVVLLHFYLKHVFFRPLARALEARYEATEGARKLAEESLAKASEKAAEYEAALQAARSEIYREQEEARQQWRREHAEAVEQARKSAEALVFDATEKLSAELAVARQALELQSESLASRIVETVLGGRAA